MSGMYDAALYTIPLPPPPPPPPLPPDEEDKPPPPSYADINEEDDEAAALRAHLLQSMKQKKNVLITIENNADSPGGADAEGRKGLHDVGDLNASWDSNVGVSVQGVETLSPGGSAISLPSVDPSVDNVGRSENQTMKSKVSCV